MTSACLLVSSLLWTRRRESSRKTILFQFLHHNYNNHQCGPQHYLEAAGESCPPSLHLFSKSAPPWTQAHGVVTKGSGGGWWSALPTSSIPNASLSATNCVLRRYKSSKKSLVGEERPLFVCRRVVKRSQFQQKAQQTGFPRTMMGLETLLEAAKFLEYKAEVEARGEFIYIFILIYKLVIINIRI
jgi:hypothetical protein